MTKSNITVKLYLPEKYQVLVGQGEQAGLCTCWSDPFALVKGYPRLLEKFALVGSLYSKEGVSIIIRNLCLNPNITTIFIWANNPLSQTPFGTAGRNTLKNLWEHGIDSEHGILGTDYKLHREIDVEIVREVIRSVQLVDISSVDLNALEQVTDGVLATSPVFSREPLDFPITQRETNKPFPSEEIGWVVRGRFVWEAWLAVVDRLVRYGKIKETEYGNRQKELLVVTWVISRERVEEPCIPDWPESLRQSIGFDLNSLQAYMQTLLVPTLPVGSAYTYGQRLRNYPPLGVDQIAQIIERLKHSQRTRRAVATTWYPPHDGSANSPPCLNQIQFLADEQKLHLFASFRSHDIFKAAAPNAFGLLNLQKFVAENTGLERGTLSITSHSAHIYEEDWKNAEDVARCQLWEAVKPGFNENTDMDSRGIVRIVLEPRGICAEIMSLDGEPLFECCGQTAREVMMKIAKLNLLSRPDHYADITMELVKAEIALKQSVVYQQDKPLAINDFFVR